MTAKTELRLLSGLIMLMIASTSLNLFDGIAELNWPKVTISAILLGCFIASELYHYRYWRI